MRIIIDAMGGDNAPSEIVKGVIRARAEQQKVDLTLVGDRRQIYSAATHAGLSLSGIDIIHTETVVLPDDNPISVLKNKSDASMCIGLKMLLPDNEYGVVGDAFLSAGSTGALHACSTLIVHKLPGVRRSGIATILPFSHPLFLMDAGANPKITEEYLIQWAIMGSIYMKKIFGIENPRVGLLNNGTEEGKGTDMLVAAHKLLRASNLNFVGNIESREIPFNPCDVLVCDGFTGNIALKLIEGMGRFMFDALREIYSANARSSISFLLIKPELEKFKKNFDASEYGGAPLLGLSRPVIKAHGNSDAKAIASAIKQAVSCVQTGITDAISEGLAEYAREVGKS